MALVGIHIECLSYGVTGRRGLSLPTHGKAFWSETMASAGVTSSVAPSVGQELGSPGFTVFPQVNAFVSIGPDPNASVSPRMFCPAQKLRDFACEPGDKLAWTPA